MIFRSLRPTTDPTRINTFRTATTPLPNGIYSAGLILLQHQPVSSHEELVSDQRANVALQRGLAYSFFLLLIRFPGEILNGECTWWASPCGGGTAATVTKIWRCAQLKHVGRPLSQVPVFGIERTQHDVRSLEHHLFN